MLLGDLEGELSVVRAVARPRETYVRGVLDVLVHLRRELLDPLKNAGL